MSIPLGCKFTFDPSDEELLVYLECKAKGEPLPWEGFISEVDLYGLNDPGALFRGTDEKLVYVFTKVKKVAKNGKRVERTVSGNRTWKGVDGGKPIYDAQGRLVGEKKNFVLVNKMKMKVGYNMTEFSLDNDILRNSRFKDYVVCKIKKKAKKFRGLNNGNIQEEIQDFPVSTLATEGDAMTISEEVYQHDDNGKSILLSQSQNEEAQKCYPVTESYDQGMGNFMPILCGDQEIINLEEIQDSPVSTPATEGDAMTISEEVYQHHDNGKSIPLSQSQNEEAQKCYPVSESYDHGMGNFMPILCGDQEVIINLEEIQDSPVSTPATEGDVMIISEEEYRHDNEGKLIVVNQSQNEETQQCYPISESYDQGMGDFMPMWDQEVIIDQGSYLKSLSSEYFSPPIYQEVNLWTEPPFPALVDDYYAAAAPPVFT